MDCPKCGQRQDDEVFCRACGIYFEKYRRQQAQIKLAASTSKELSGAAEASAGTAKVVLRTIAVIAIGALLYTKFQAGNKPLALAPQSRIDQSQIDIKKSPLTPASVPAQPLLTGVAAQLAKSNPPGNTIEAARNATVFIKTGWGALGSGFLIDAECHGITNRHVLDFDPDKIVRKVEDDPRFRVQLDVAKDRLRAGIERLQWQRATILANRKGSVIDAEQLAHKIRELEEELADLPNAVEAKMRNELLNAVPEENTKKFTVVLIDGSEYPMTQADFAEGLDLALFKLPAVSCPYIQHASSEKLNQGDRLFTIGSPSGLKFTVTSGIFSGYRELDKHRTLQTDAPINPGNSGGPLINEAGHIVGVNTAILTGTQGIGFAIPIEQVYESFFVLRDAQ